MDQNILDYQQQDGVLRRIENELQNSEERKRAAAAKSFLLEGEEVIAKTDKKAGDLLVKFQNLQHTLAECVQMSEEYEALMKESKEDEDELSYLNKKIQQLNDTLKKTEHELTVISQQMEETAKSFVAYRQKFGAAKEEYTKNKKKYDELKAAKAGEIEAVKEKMAGIAKGVDKKILERYQAVRNDKIFPVLVPLNGNMCGGCNTELSLNEMGRLKNQGYIECDNCKRIIYQK